MTRPLDSRRLAFTFFLFVHGHARPEFKTTLSIAKYLQLAGEPRIVTRHGYKMHYREIGINAKKYALV